jgi:hypothetical protein
MEGYRSPSTKINFESERVVCGKFLGVSVLLEFWSINLISVGNFYSIENDYDKPARIFFSQGCEILEEAAESQ